MKLDQRGTEFIQNWEKCEHTVYKDQAGIPTVGYGHKNTKLVLGTIFTQSQCDQLFAEDILSTECAVSSFANIPLTQKQFNALVSLSFNIGASAFKASTLLKLLNAKYYRAAAEQFLVWDKYHTADGQAHVSQGLADRRKAERELFLES